MNLVNRVTNIALRPKEEWPVINEEKETVQSLYMNVILPLAAIGPVCGALSSFVFGNAWLGPGIRPTSGAIIVELIVGYAMALISVYVMAFIIHKLAPNFNSEGDLPQALKLATYAYAPMWVAGVLKIIPFLGVLVFFVALYGFYLVYLGLPVMMKTPQDKVGIYLIVVIAVSIVVSVIAGVVTTAFVGAGLLAGAL